MTMGNPGASPGRSASWWKRHGKRRRLNPNRIGTHSVKDKSTVEWYMKHPNATGDTPVCVVYRGSILGGGYWAREGAHRIEADRRMRRRTRCLVVDLEKERSG